MLREGSAGTVRQNYSVEKITYLETSVFELNWHLALKVDPIFGYSDVRDGLIRAV